MLPNCTTTCTSNMQHAWQRCRSMVSPSVGCGRQHVQLIWHSQHSSRVDDCSVLHRLHFPLHVFHASQYLPVRDEALTTQANHTLMSCCTSSETQRSRRRRCKRTQHDPWPQPQSIVSWALPLCCCCCCRASHSCCLSAELGAAPHGTALATLLYLWPMSTSD